MPSRMTARAASACCMLSTRSPTTSTPHAKEHRTATPHHTPVAADTPMRETAVTALAVEMTNSAPPSRPQAEKTCGVAGEKRDMFGGWNGSSKQGFAVARVTVARQADPPLTAARAAGCPTSQHLRPSRSSKSGAGCSLSQAALLSRQSFHCRSLQESGCAWRRSGGEAGRQPSIGHLPLHACMLIGRITRVGDTVHQPERAASNKPNWNPTAMLGCDRGLLN